MSVGLMRDALPQHHLSNRRPTTPSPPRTRGYWERAGVRGRDPANGLGESLAPLRFRRGGSAKAQASISKCSSIASPLTLTLSQYPEYRGRGDQKRTPVPRSGSTLGSTPFGLFSLPRKPWPGRHLAAANRGQTIPRTQVTKERIDTAPPPFPPTSGN